MTLSADRFMGVLAMLAAGLLSLAVVSGCGDTRIADANNAAETATHLSPTDAIPPEDCYSGQGLVLLAIQQDPQTWSIPRPQGRDVLTACKNKSGWTYSKKWLGPKGELLPDHDIACMLWDPETKLSACKP